MANVNKSIILGRLTQDPEPHGTIITFNVATNESWTDKDGKKQEHTEFHNVKAFGKQAEVIAQYVHKGRELYIEGKSRTEAYETNSGDKKYFRYIYLESFTFVGDNQNQNQNQNQSTNNNYVNDDVEF